MPRNEHTLVLISYLLDHPHAQNSLQAIAEWWLNTKNTITELDNALEDLVEEGLVEQTRSSDRNLHLRIPKTKVDKVRRLLNLKDERL